MKVFFNAFWAGFLEKTDPVHLDFFLQLFEAIWKQPIQIGSKEESEILCESIFGPSALQDKAWNVSVLFSGESHLQQREGFDALYTIVLYGQRNHGNRINCPLFVPYLVCNGFVNRLEAPCTRTSVPSRAAAVAVLSNPTGAVRNRFLEALEKRVEVVYGGGYKTTEPIRAPYWSREFQETIGTFKFVITMENSRDDTYITEKICHGFLAQTIPVYWGSPRVGDYFNTERFLCLTSEEEIDTVVSEIERLLKDDAAWLTKVQQPVFTGGKLWRTVEDIARDCRNLLAQHRFKPVDQTFYLCNQEFEPERYSRLVELSTQLGLPADSYSFHCPTFKHTITDELYLKHVSPPHSYLYPELQGPERKMRRAELSLTLNYLSLFEEIDKRWLDGLFLTLESDVRPTGEIGWSPQLFQTLFEKRDQWEGVHIGGLPEDVWKTEFPETLSSASDLIRFVRHLNTRCSDSLVWTKRGIERFLAFMKSDPLYIEPFDGYLCQYLSNYQDKFRYFWSHPTFFMQRSYYDGEASTIQNHNY